MPIPSSSDRRLNITPATDTVGRDLRCADRRCKPSSFHLPERRTGFDRRREYPFTSFLRNRPANLLVVLLAVNTLSGLDFAFTYIQLATGMATEANPMLAELYSQSAVQAWLFKTGVMLIVSLGIWRARKHRAILSVAIASLVLYLFVIGYHIVGMAYSGAL